VLPSTYRSTNRDVFSSLLGHSSVGLSETVFMLCYCIPFSDWKIGSKMLVSKSWHFHSQVKKMPAEPSTGSVPLW